MKWLAAIALMITVNVAVAEPQSREQVCERVGALGEYIITWRQDGESQQWVTDYLIDRIKTKPVREITMGIIDAAYDMPIETNALQREVMIQRFTKACEIVCLDDL